MTFLVAIITSAHHYLLLSAVLLKQLLQDGRVGTEELIDLLAILEDGEGGHGADTELLGKVGELVDVELGEVNALVLGPLAPSRIRGRQIVSTGTANRFEIGT